MDNREAKRILSNYVFWRDVRIKSVEDELNSICTSITPSYSALSGSMNVSDPTSKESIRKALLRQNLDYMKRAVLTVERVKGHLSEDMNLAFHFLIYPRKQSWKEITDYEKSGMTEAEFRTKRRKILRYIKEAFDGISLLDCG